MLTVVQVYKDLHFIDLPNHNLGAAIISRSNLISPNVIRKAPHSYDGTGRVLLWFPNIHFRKLAVDFEHVSREVNFISRILGLNEKNFLQNWVCNEVVAKILNVPIIKLIKDNGNKLIKFIEEESLFQVCTYDNISVFYFKLDNLQAHIAFGFV